MANQYFEFKQFTVHQDKCAMKVGTDGVLLGVLADIRFIANFTSIEILDIGAGTGLVSLIAAQRLSQAYITAVEIDSDSAEQAKENFEQSRFASRLKVVQSSIQDFLSDKKYDLILCNPPFYNGTLTCPDSKRTLARHTLSLTFEDLAKSAERLLSADGEFVVIVPTYEENKINEYCSSLGLFPKSITKIYPNERKDAKRIVIQYSRNNLTTKEKRLVIDAAPGEKSAEFRELVKDYYLKY